MKLARSLAPAWLGLAVLSLGLQQAALGARTVKEIEKDLAQVNPEVAKYGPLDTTMDPKYQHALHMQMLPALQKKIELLRELLEAHGPNPAAGRYQLNVDLAAAATLGDDAAGKSLETASSDADPQVAEAAKMGLALRDWWADQTEPAQQTVLKRLEEMAKSQPTDDQVARTLLTMSDNRAASPRLAEEARATVEGMKGPVAIRYCATPNRIGRPLVISGATVDGKAISSTAFKGKVIMVDFWATWCPPCRAELPHVIEVYKKYYDQGFEIIAVSNDSDRNELRQFLKANPDMKWPQLFGPSSTPSHWHSLTQKFGISGIPTVYLIDRNGILRSMNGRMHLSDDTIPELLAEKPEK